MTTDKDHEEKGVESLIDGLAEDLSGSVVIHSPLLRFCIWSVLSVVYVVVIVLLAGVRSDISLMSLNTVFLFEVLLMGALSLSSAAAACWLTIPDMRGQRWIITVPLTLLGCFVVWSVVRAYTEGDFMPELHWGHCGNESLLFGLVPALWIGYLSRNGTTTAPMLMGVMNAMSAGALAYTGLRFTCANDTVGHACLLHLLPYIILGLIIGAYARRLYRW